VALSHRAAAPGGRGAEGPSGQSGASSGRPVAPRGCESVLEPPPQEGGNTDGNGLIMSIVAVAWKGAATTSSFGSVDDEARCSEMVEVIE